MKKTLALWGLVACAASPAWAQFELPKVPERAASSAGGFSAPAAPAAPQRLSFQYNYLVEITSTFKHDPDLDRRLRDDIQLLKPKLTGSFTYRPTNWLAATVEVTAKREYAIQEEASTTLPSGDVTTPPRRQSSLRVEQLLITARHSPFELNVGRRNYEDERHFLFDGSIDVVALNYRHEDWRGELMIGRDIFWQWDALQHIDKQPIEMALLHA